MNNNVLYDNLIEHRQKIADLQHASALLHWDQETYMPPKSANFRGQQLSTLSGVTHELAVSSELGELLQSLSQENGLNDIQKINVSKIKKDFDKEKKYSTDFVKKMTKTISECSTQWGISRKEDNFASFAPYLQRLVEMKREEAEILGYVDHPYNALLDQFEEGNTVAQLNVLFDELKKELIPFLKKIAEAPQVNDDFLIGDFPHAAQWDFGIEVLKKMGYDFEAGRQDISLHPFTTNFSAQDVRITTRVSETDFREMLWSTIHEGGHALYEQGLNPDHYGMPSGSYCSLAIHESQSRLWENNIGRYKPFWDYHFALLCKQLSGCFDHINIEKWYHAINKVTPSLIRVAADELTYHFHIIIRYEIEQALVSGELKVSELPDYWNAKYKSYLGVEVPSDAQGVLQDVHWSAGLFGYFPTYTQGSLYAAQFYAHICKLYPDIEGEFATGNFSTLLTILRENIHQHGKSFNSDEICKNFTGESLDAKYFIDYAKRKYAEIYQL